MQTRASRKPNRREAGWRPFDHAFSFLLARTQDDDRVSGLARIHRTILRTFVLAAGLAAIGMSVAAAATGDYTGMLTRSSFSGALAFFAWWRLQRRGSAVPVLAAGTVVIVAAIAARQSLEAVSSGTLGIVGLALAAALLAERRVLVFALATFAIGAITVIRSQLIDESTTDLVGAALVPMIVIIFGSQLMEWAKDEISGRQRRFNNLFDHAPVATFEEDFSLLAAWLDGLRASGVTDLRAYLDDYPDEILHGASLIQVLDVNEETVRFLNAPNREVLLGPLDTSLLVEGSQLAMVEELVAVWEGIPHVKVELTGARPDGSPIEGYLLMAAPQTDGRIDWTRVVVAMVDVSEQRAAQRRLEELVDSKDQFVASVSHELRTPLTAVIGLADELRGGAAPVGEHERDELLSLIAEQAVEVGNIVEDLLIAAQADIGRVNIASELVDLRHAVEGLVAEVGIAFRPFIDVEAGVVAVADPRRLRQILRNLVSNAYRYGGDQVSITARNAGGETILEVSDNGAGIPEDLEERVFEPYQTAHRAVGVTGSVGLGLTVSRQLARLMEGELSYRRVGDLTTFRLILPAATGAGVARLVS